MKFCKYCSSMMKLEGKRFMCACGHEESAEKITLEQNSSPRKEVKILESDINPLAVDNHLCSKCGFGKAQLVSKGIFVSDEDEMTEYVCGKCGHHDPEDGLKS